MTRTAGHLADNIAHFARALRSAGVRAGPDATLAAVEAVRHLDLGRRADFHTALKATLLTRHEDETVFDEMFKLFWRSRNLDERLIAILSPKAPPRAGSEKPEAGTRRVQEALAEHAARSPSPRERPSIEIDARQTSSRDELLRAKDFAQMSEAELAEARRAVARLSIPDERIATRRYAPAPRGVLDMRRTQARSLRTGGDVILPAFRRRRQRHSPVVILADISGSMARYSEIVLRFAHALTERRRDVSTFLFGTRLTNVSRALRHRDPDEAIARISSAVADWSGGTRIGPALLRFNRDWSRRVLGRGAIVLLVTDGLELGAVDELSHEAERLSRSCRRLIWLSPLLGYEHFAPKARGVRALLAHVHQFRPVHSIEAIEALCKALSGDARADHDPRRWLASAAA